jgi:hypothetical protein
MKLAAEISKLNYRSVIEAFSYQGCSSVFPAELLSYMSRQDLQLRS